MSRPRGFAVDLYGRGQVGRALLPLLRENEIAIATVRDTKGVRIARPVGRRTRVLVDATSPAYEGDAAEAWMARLEDALAAGTPVVTCNKAPLATGWSRLARAANAGGTTLSCAGTVGGGTPVLLLLHRLHRSHGIARVEAAFNATTNYVLARVARGASIPEAVRAAQRAGWAEPDPTLDLDGTDATAKGVIVHNLLFDDRAPLALRASRPRQRLREGRIRRLARSGNPPRALAAVTPGRIALGIVGASAARGVPDGIGLAAVRAVLRDRSAATLTGPGAGPRATAGALLGDLLALRDAGASGATGVVP